VHPDVDALLAVQSDDEEIFAIEAKIAELAPRLEKLARERDREQSALAQARQSLESEERRRRDMETRLSHHRQLQERSQAQLNSITSPREATAAMAQAEQTRRMVHESERDIDALDRRISELKRAVQDREAAVTSVEQQQTDARASLEADRAKLDAELAEVRARRDTKAQGVPRATLARYDRILGKRRSQVVYALRGGSCSHCDTVIPVQRRATMAGSGALEACEGCGMLLYAAD
jgi:uncharacterized protein